MVSVHLRRFRCILHANLYIDFIVIISPFDFDYHHITFKYNYLFVLFKCRENVCKCFVQAPEVVFSLHRVFSICLTKKLIDEHRRP